MNIVYLGSGEFGIPSLDGLVRSKYDLRFIVTQPTRAAGRGRKTLPTPVAQWAGSHSIPFIETENANTPEAVGKIADLKPDLIVVIAFGQKIGKELITLPPKGAINVHASLLPRYRGAAPINWAIINGETETGVTIITLAEKMDAGQILSMEKTEIYVGETAGQLHDRLAKTAAPLLLKTIDRITDGTITYTEQDHSKATLAPKLKKSDGFLDFNETAEILARKIRGLWPWPGATAVYSSKQTQKSLGVTIAMAEAVKDSNPHSLSPGTLDENLNIICGRDSLKITKIKPDGSRLMDFADFVNGRHISAGDMFMKNTGLHD
jgi:methionyl-tRNA formyltransferase